MDTKKFAHKLLKIFGYKPAGKVMSFKEKAYEMSSNLDAYQKAPCGFQKSYAENKLIVNMAESWVNYYMTSLDVSSITSMTPVVDMKAKAPESETGWVTPTEFSKLYPDMGRGSSIVRALADDPVSLDYGCAKKTETGRWLLNPEKVLYFFSVSEKNTRYQPRAYKYRKEMIRKKQQNMMLSSSEPVNPFHQYGQWRVIG
jgi:hypothetical protein